MLRFHILQNLRSAFFLAILAAVMALPVLLWAANRSGLPDSWRTFIQQELSHQGVHLEIGAIRYLPLHGIAASNVRVFADEERDYELSRFETILLDLDKTMLARGEVRLNKIELANARMLVPVDTGEPTGETLELVGVYGTVLMPGGGVFEIRDARGQVGGIHVTADARLISYRSTGHGGLPEDDRSRRGKRREFIATIIREIERWSYPEDRPPHVRVRINGDLADLSTFTSSFTLEAPVMAMAGHPLKNIRASGGLRGEVVSVESFAAEDERGSIDARADFDLRSRAGRFDAESSIDLVALGRAWFGVESPDDIIIGGNQSLAAAGDFHIDENGGPPEIRATGRMACNAVMVRGVVFDVIESAFSWRDGALLLRDARASRSDGVASGKVLVEWPNVRMAAETTLPVPLYKPFFAGQPLEEVIESFTTDGNSRLRVALEGGFTIGDHQSWAYAGNGEVHRVRYNGVPVASATASFAVSHHELDFRRGELVLDTRAYPQRTAFGGPPQVTARVGAIRFVNRDQVIHVEDVRGDFWVPPVLRLFNPVLADSIEAYQFHRPPSLRCSGVVDLTPAGRTRMEIGFQTPAAAATEVLGEEITFSRASGRVLLRGERVDVRDLALEAFDGPINASFIHENDTLTAEVMWTRLNLSALAAQYGVKMQGGGTTTGRIEFSQRGGDIRTLAGEGNTGFENAHLFAVPVLGPLSPLISAVVNDRRAGYERAKDGYLSFAIKDGVLRTSDFQTATTSLVFTGDGAIDLNNNTVDMTMRMNARGLLGIITLPLRPFYGLFQFRGTGPMREPVWENVMFSAPPANQKDRLMAPPRATIIEQ